MYCEQKESYYWCIREFVCLPSKFDCVVQIWVCFNYFWSWRFYCITFSIMFPECMRKPQDSYSCAFWIENVWKTRHLRSGKNFVFIFRTIICVIFPHIQSGCSQGLTFQGSKVRQALRLMRPTYIHEFVVLLLWLLKYQHWPFPFSDLLKGLKYRISTWMRREVSFHFAAN